MRAVRYLLILLAAFSAAFGATFGTVRNIIGGASDLVLDEARSQLYLVTETSNNIAIYSTRDNRFLATTSGGATIPIPVDSQPIAAAMSRDGRFLYVTSYGAATLDVIDLNRNVVTSKVSLPDKPEGVAVGADGRVLITTVGTGSNGTQNNLLIYDPAASGTASVKSVVVTPPAPTPPSLPAPSGRIYLAARSQLMATRDGRYIIGINNPNASTRVVFVYEAASGTVVRSRSVGSISTVLSISPDGASFMAGLSLFDTATLAVLAQQNVANSLYPYPTGTNFNLQQNQGGSVFSPDGSYIYSAFNIAPIQNPPARANVSQLLVNDPFNLFINLGLQLNENLAGKMVITADGSAIYGLSDSGFMILPMVTVSQSPLAMTDYAIAVLNNDQCGMSASGGIATVAVQNYGKGAMTASATLLAPGDGAVLSLAPTTPIGPGGGGNNNALAALQKTAPSVSTTRGATPQINFSYNTSAAASLGTTGPYDYLIQSPEAINIPPRVRIYENNRNTEATASTIPVAVSTSATEGLYDMIVDSTRQRLYIANSGMNRIEVFDTRQKQFLSPIRVGQMPHSLALSPDGSTLFVANSGGESISVVDPDKGQMTGKVNFPPIPINAAEPIVTPGLIADGLSGLQLVMSDGTLWQVIGNNAVPRLASPAIGTAANGRPVAISAPRQMAATPEGQYILLLAGNGYAYLYDATVDDYVIGRQIFTNPIQGYYGPVAAGPRGQYYLANGIIMNQSLTPVAAAPSVAGAAGRTGQVTQTGQPVAAVAVATTSTFLRFSPPTVTSVSNTTAAVSAPASVEVADVNTGTAISSVPALEGPATLLAGTARANISGRTMALSPSDSTAYVISASGLSVVPLPAATGGRGNAMSITRNGIVNIANYQTGVVPGNLVSIFGSNLGSTEIAGAMPLPTMMGGICVTMNSTPMPLMYTSAGQVNAQIPPTMAAGRYSVVVRTLGQGAASAPFTMTVVKYAPAVFSDPKTGQALVYDSKGRLVTKSNPISRDEHFTMYAAGLGATTGGKLVAGHPAPSSPLAVTGPVRVFFGTPSWTQAEMIVDWSGLAPGFIGLYQINGTVPGDRIHGDGLPVSVSVGGVSSPSTGTGVPFTSVN